jgi:hypothetical protein
LVVVALEAAQAQPLVVPIACSAQSPLLEVAVAGYLPETLPPRVLAHRAARVAAVVELVGLRHLSAAQPLRQRKVLRVATATTGLLRLAVVEAALVVLVLQEPTVQMGPTVVLV